jgi:hypothetical protein
MSNDWKIKKGDVEGGETGRLLDGCEIRLNPEGTAYEFIAVLTKTPGDKPPTDEFDFPPFAYRGLIWNVSADIPDTAQEQIAGGWGNNARFPLTGDESGTYTAQSGPGTVEETSEGKEDAASASA